MLNIVPVLRLVDIQGFVTTNSNMLDFPITFFNFLTDQRTNTTKYPNVSFEFLNCIEQNENAKNGENERNQEKELN